MGKQQTQPPLAPNAWLRYDSIHRFLGKHQPGSILELGAGGGALGARLQAHARYSAVEPDDESRALAASRLTPETTLIADLRELDESARFDMICAFEVLEHIEDDAAALREWLHLLEPQGLVLVSVPAHRRRFSDADVIAGHYRRYDPSDMAELLHEVGLIDVAVETYGFPLGHALEAARNFLARRANRSEDPIESRTAASGRFHQPTSRSATITRFGTAPFRHLQRPFRATDLGVGLLAWGRMPVDET